MNDSEFAALRADVAEIKGILLGAKPAPAVETFGFTRPAVRDVSPWLDKRMPTPDPVEAMQRALHGVSWAGTVLSDERYEAAWEEVQYLLAAQPFDPRCAPYLGTVPEVALFGLLTGAAALPDETSFGQYGGSRDPQKLRGVASIADYLAGLPTYSHGGTPSGW